MEAEAIRLQAPRRRPSPRKFIGAGRQFNWHMKDETQKYQRRTKQFIVYTIWAGHRHSQAFWER